MNMTETKQMRPMKIGDTVRATKVITRRDFRCILHTGSTAEVITASNGTKDGIQIVGIRLPDGDQMIDIVCENGIPLKLIEPA